MRRIVICVAVVAAGVTVIAAGGNRDARVATPGSSNAVLRTPVSLVPTTIAPVTTTLVAAAARPHRVAPVTTIPRRRKPANRAKQAQKRPPVIIDPAQLAFLRAQALNACSATTGANHAAVVGANDAWHRQQVHRLAAIRPRPNAQYAELMIQEQQAQLEIQAEYTIDVSNCYLKYP